MAEARDRAAWNHTFAIVAQIHNYHRDPNKSQAIDWRLCCPHLAGGPTKPKRAPPPTPEQRAMLRQMFPAKHR